MSELQRLANTVLTAALKVASGPALARGQVLGNEVGSADCVNKIVIMVLPAGAKVPSFAAGSAPVVEG